MSHVHRMLIFNTANFSITLKTHQKLHHQGLLQNINIDRHIRIRFRNDLNYNNILKAILCQ